MSQLLQIEGLSLEESGKLLFDQCTLSLGKGDHIVIVGESGGGKSTLLNLIADKDPRAVSDASLSTSMVLQEGALLDHLNVIDNLNLIRAYSAKVPDSAAISAQSRLQQLNISEDLWQAPIHSLSGGQMRRVAIARALMTKPELMLFDEPDAGLDLINLSDLGSVMRDLRNRHNMTCVTVSHNPYYVSRIATHVYRLVDGQLELLCHWPEQGNESGVFESRQRELESKLMEHRPDVKPTSRQAGSKQSTLRDALSGINALASSFTKVPLTKRGEFGILLSTFHLSFVSGLMFWSLVGLMLGATLVAVVKSLADAALIGIVSWFVKPEDLIDIMRGRFSLYLAPAIGAMLFAARSGSIVSGWIGEMIRSKQLRALQVLNVSVSQYLLSPVFIGLLMGLLVTLTLFTLAIWLGGVFAVFYLFDIPNAAQTMYLTGYDFYASNYWIKVLLYSVIVCLVISAFAFANKFTAKQVNLHTTQGIIYATLSVALAELLIILNT